jgi:hypothetical protein
VKLADDLREFVALLNSANVEYLIVGGHAVGYHGYPRYTGDIDIFIRRSPENAARVASVLDSFGFGGLGADADTFLKPDMVVQLGRPPNRIDILTRISGVDFEDAWPNRERALLDGVPVAMIGRDALLANKRASGRPKDLADVRELEETK